MDSTSPWSITLPTEQRVWRKKAREARLEPGQLPLYQTYVASSVPVLHGAGFSRRSWHKRPAPSFAQLARIVVGSPLDFQGSGWLGGGLKFGFLMFWRRN